MSDHGVARGHSAILGVRGGAVADGDAVGVVLVARAVLLRQAVERVVGRRGGAVAQPIARRVVRPANHLVRCMIRQILGLCAVRPPYSPCPRG